MKKHLFYTVLFIFSMSSLITLLGVAGVVTIPDTYLDKLVWAFLGQLAVAVISLFRKTDFFGEETARRIEKLQTSVVETALTVERVEKAETGMITELPGAEFRAKAAEPLGLTAQQYFDGLEVRNERPLEREHWLEGIEGSEVQWTAEFSDVSTRGDRRHHVMLKAGPGWDQTVFYDAPESERDVVYSLRKGDEVTISGRLSVRSLRIAPLVKGGKIERVIKPIIPN